MTPEQANYASGVSMLSYPFWRDLLEAASNLASTVVPILGAVLVCMQIYLTFRKARAIKSGDE
ncbi:hypothetical protein [Pseudovibrio sp. SPO723]|uniref:hypothetical protein n=1 Tax=Nesiotobacter zosterae TaxID=392721 RepID=UPI0029C57740|nr:hypothetical protein [Pseudovibrio sp. SPO723]MDX5595666.1 hypothetical protein [Pseudovibrio sp. SPO723]